jgi:hypothetical protein
MNIEEATCVGPRKLVTFLFALNKIVTSTCVSDRLLKVVEPLPGVDRVVAEALKPSERRRIQSHREVDDLGDVEAPCDFNGRRVTAQPLLRSLLDVVLGDADRLEALRVLVAAEPRRKSWKAVAAVSTFDLDFLAYLAPGVDHRPRIAAFIDVLAQVFWRRSMIGLSRVSGFIRLPTEGYTQGGRFSVGMRQDQELEGADNTRFRQVQAAICVMPYVLYHGLYCLDV